MKAFAAAFTRGTSENLVCEASYPALDTSVNEETSALSAELDISHPFCSHTELNTDLKEGCRIKRSLPFSLSLQINLICCLETEEMMVMCPVVFSSASQQHALCS